MKALQSRIHAEKSLKFFVSHRSKSCENAQCMKSNCNNTHASVARVLVCSLCSSLSESLLGVGTLEQHKEKNATEYAS